MTNPLDDALLLLPDVKTYDAARRELEALRARANMAEGLLLELKANVSEWQGRIDKTLAGLKAGK